MRDLLIIGAGISGLRAAVRAEALGLDYPVLEARDRVGGRAYGVISSDRVGFDLGPSWIWPEHQPRVRALVETLGLRTFDQFETQRLRYETQAGVQTLDFPRRYGDAKRLSGGPGALALALADQLPGNRIRLEAEVTSLTLDAGVRVTLAKGEVLEAKRVVLAVPPRLVTRWVIEPTLPDTLTRALNAWPTWMAAHAKIFLQYDTPFWRSETGSGSGVSQVGPLAEIVDHSDDEARLFALFGFYGWPAAVRTRRAESLEAETLDQLERLFGPKARNPIKIGYKDWSSDPFTAVAEDAPGPNGHPPYGERALRQPWFDGKLLFAGAEAAAEQGGLIEGALLAADTAMDQVEALAERS